MPPRTPGAPARFPLPLLGILIYAGIRGLSLAVSAFLLPRGKFRGLHYSFPHLMGAWDSGRYLTIAVHGYSYVPGSIRAVPISAWFPRYPAAIRNIAWFPGYPAAIRYLMWISGVSPAVAALTVTAVAGLAAAWGLTRLGLALTGEPRVSLISVALWAAAPGSIVLFMMYSEALFCALASWVLIALVEQRWLAAAALTIGAGTVRSSALALVAAVTVAVLPGLLSAARARPPLAAWWRPAAALLAAPLGLLGFLGYVAWAIRRPGGWFWIEQSLGNGFDGGRSVMLALTDTIIAGPKAFVALTLLVLAAAVALTLCSLTERMPWCLHVYTLVIVATTLASGPSYLGSKPRFLLPAVLIGFPLARLLARARTWVLIPLIAVLAAASTWFSLYLMSVGWAL